MREQEPAFQGDLDQYFNLGEMSVSIDWPSEDSEEPFTLTMLEEAMEAGFPMRKEWQNARII